MREKAMKVKHKWRRIALELNWRDHCDEEEKPWGGYELSDQQEEEEVEEDEDITAEEIDGIQLDLNWWDMIRAPEIDGLYIPMHSCRK